MARESIFKGKTDGVRIQGVLTQHGGRAFNRKRKQLASLFRDIVGRQAPTISDAEVAEFMARGVQETITVLEGIRDQG